LLLVNPGLNADYLDGSYGFGVLGTAAFAASSKFNLFSELCSP
jgi:hypothetical protein